MQLAHACVVLLLLTWFEAGHVGGDYANSFATLMNNGTRMCVWDPMPSNVTTTTSKHFCAGACQRNLACVQFNFNKDSNRCEMFSMLGARNCSSIGTGCSNYRVSQCHSTYYYSVYTTALYSIVNIERFKDSIIFHPVQIHADDVRGCPYNYLVLINLTTHPQFSFPR